MIGKPPVLFLPTADQAAALDALIAGTIAGRAHAFVPCVRTMVAGYLDRLSTPDRRLLLYALGTAHRPFLKKQLGVATIDRQRVLQHAFLLLAEETTHWTPDLALQVVRTLRLNDAVGRHWKIGSTLRAIDRAGIVLDRAADTDAEFAAIADRLGDAAQPQPFRQLVHRLFGRIYVPRLTGVHCPYDDRGFLLALDHLIRALRQFEAEQGGPGEPLARVFRDERVFALDDHRLAAAEAGYRAWEERFGARRWSEVLPPGWPADAAPALLDHLAKAKPAVPGDRWLRRADDLIAALDPGDAADLLSGQAAWFGDGGDVAESEASWIGPARIYAGLHRLYGERRGAADDALASVVTGSWRHHLPWWRVDGTPIEHCPPDNPFAVSAANIVHMKGVAWLLPRVLGEDAVDPLATLVTGGAATLATVGGPRARALAVANAAIWSLARLDTPRTRATLASLAGDVVEPRIGKALAALV